MYSQHYIQHDQHMLSLVASQAAQQKMTILEVLLSGYFSIGHSMGHSVNLLPTIFAELDATRCSCSKRYSCGQANLANPEGAKD